MESFLDFQCYFAMGTYYWSSLVGERKADSRDPPPSPHWDKHNLRQDRNESSIGRRKEDPWYVIGL